MQADDQGEETFFGIIRDGEVFSLPDGTRVDPQRVSAPSFDETIPICPQRKPWLRWPRGKRNGRRITGVSVELHIDVDHWTWRPFVSLKDGVIHWFCFMSWFRVLYASDIRV